MSIKPKDRRPKILSFPQPIRGLAIAVQENLLWPCLAFNISIPKKKKGILNIFEETVLKLTELEGGNTAILAQTLGLEQELLVFIQNRLFQLGLLSNRYEITKEGTNYLQNRHSGEEAELEYTAATVFIDVRSGNVLPFVYTGFLQYEKIIEIKKQTVIIETGTVGNAQTKHCRLIPPGSTAYWHTVPSVHDITKALKDFKRNYKRYALLQHQIIDYPLNGVEAEKICIHENPELVYIHCKLIMQKGNTELLVTDGFGFGFSKPFADDINAGIDENFSQWFTHIKQKGIIEKAGAGRYAEQSEKTPYHFPEITRRFVYDSPDGKNFGIFSLLQQLSCLPASTAEEKEYTAKTQRIITKLYAALEWALRYLVSTYPVENWEALYVSQHMTANKELLCRFAAKIGLHITEKNITLLEVKEGAIRQLDRGTVMVQPLIALAVTGAGAVYSEHPLSILAQQYPDFLSFLCSLKQLRDAFEHGSLSVWSQELKPEKLQVMIEDAVSIITLLLPAIRPELCLHTNGASKVDSSVYTDINQERLKAQLSIEAEIGYAFFSALSLDVQELLIRCKILMQPFSTDNVPMMINYLYGCIQQFLLETIKKQEHPHMEENSIRAAAFAAITAAGFYSAAETLPPQISTVPARRVLFAAQGKSETLGAQLLALFAAAGTDDLMLLIQKIPHFITFISGMIALRGHGNTASSDISEEKIIKLWQSTIDVFKTLTEVFK